MSGPRLDLDAIERRRLRIVPEDREALLALIERSRWKVEPGLAIPPMVRAAPRIDALASGRLIADVQSWQHEHGDARNVFERHVEIAATVRALEREQIEALLMNVELLRGFTGRRGATPRSDPPDVTLERVVARLPDTPRRPEPSLLLALLVRVSGLPAERLRGYLRGADARARARARDAAREAGWSVDAIAAGLGFARESVSRWRV